MANSTYQLIDFGDGEKLEEFGETLVRRPNLYARGTKSSPKDWGKSSLQFDLESETWSGTFPNQDWYVDFGKSKFGLKPTPVGHVGVFPEQQENWKWIDSIFGQSAGMRSVEALDRTDGVRKLKALNLFAYTGGSTMALAHCGIEVAHVDGAANIVNWAASNAKASNLGDATIRWIVEDAMRFVNREIKRGNTYDILVADPPSFGRGPKKEQWRIARDLPLLLDLINDLMPSPVAIILSCHTKGFERNVLSKMLRASLASQAGNLEAIKMKIRCRDRATQLDAGECVRWLASQSKDPHE